MPFAHTPQGKTAVIRPKYQHPPPTRSGAGTQHVRDTLMVLRPPATPNSCITRFHSFSNCNAACKHEQCKVPLAITPYPQDRVQPSELQCKFWAKSQCCATRNNGPRCPPVLCNALQRAQMTNQCYDRFQVPTTGTSALGYSTVASSAALWLQVKCSTVASSATTNPDAVYSTNHTITYAGSKWTNPVQCPRL
jgi:hypothetical protein